MGTDAFRSPIVLLRVDFEWEWSFGATFDITKWRVRTVSHGAAGSWTCTGSRV